MELGQRSSFASLHKPQVLTGIIPLLEIGVSAFILPIRVSEDRWILCVFSHVAPSFTENIQSQMVSKAVIECSPASAGLRQGKGQASGWKRGLPTPPSSAAGLRHGQEPQVPLASSSTSQAEASVPGAAAAADGLPARSRGPAAGHVTAPSVGRASRCVPRKRDGKDVRVTTGRRPREEREDPRGGAWGGGLCRRAH